MQIQKQNLCELVVQSILKDIGDGVLKPGEKLPSEQEMSARFGVSRHVLREALRSLEGISVVETQSGMGTYIKKNAPDDFSTHLTSLLLLSEIDEKNFFDVRVALEMLAVRLAVINMTPGLAAELKAIIAKMESAVSKGDRMNYIKANLQFHESIVEASENKLLITFYKTLQGLIGMFQAKLPKMYSTIGPESTLANSGFILHLKDSLQEHKEILQEMLNGNLECSAEKMERHLEQRYKLLSEIVAEEKQGK